jgi:hypothetical protein
MYDSTSCSYAGALDLKGPTASGGSTGGGGAVTGGGGGGGGGSVGGGGGGGGGGIKQENWSYRGLTCGSTFQQLKQSVEKAKQALADRGGYLAGAFSPPPRANPSAISPTASITGEFARTFVLLSCALFMRPLYAPSLYAPQSSATECTLIS